MIIQQKNETPYRKQGNFPFIDRKATPGTPSSPKNYYTRDILKFIFNPHLSHNFFPYPLPLAICGLQSPTLRPLMARRNRPRQFPQDPKNRMEGQQKELQIFLPTDSNEKWALVCYTSLGPEYQGTSSVWLTLISLDLRKQGHTFWRATPVTFPLNS